MGSTTRIEWCDATFNPITGCTPCSPGCDRCYARMMLRRHLPEMKHPGDPGTVTFHADRLDIPLHWRKPRRIFVNSMSDTFHGDNAVEWVDAMHAAMVLADQHTYMLLTKRPGNAQVYYSDYALKQRIGDCLGTRFKAESFAKWPVAGQSLYSAISDPGFTLPLPNVWLGVTVCTKAELAKLDILRQTPAALRFVSFEPMLEDLGTVDLTGIGWVIVGGETAPGARIMGYLWPRDLLNQCQVSGVPFFYKGAGTGTLPKSHQNYHLLDGREWHQFPEAPHA